MTEMEKCVREIKRRHKGSKLITQKQISDNLLGYYSDCYFVVAYDYLDELKRGDRDEDVRRRS